MRVRCEFRRNSSPASASQHKLIALGAAAPQFRAQQVGDARTLLNLKSSRVPKCEARACIRRKIPLEQGEVFSMAVSCKKWHPRIRAREAQAATFLGGSSSCQNRLSQHDGARMARDTRIMRVGNYVAVGARVMMRETARVAQSLLRAEVERPLRSGKGSQYEVLWAVYYVAKVERPLRSGKGRTVRSTERCCGAQRFYKP